MASTVRGDGVLIKASPVKQAPLFSGHGDKTGHLFWLPKKHQNIEQVHVDYDHDLFKPIPRREDWSKRMNPLLGMCILGFDQHRPIVLTPDLLWHQIVKAIAMHVDVNSEALTHKLVNHEGKTDLNVTRDDFIRGGKNDWPAVFKGFRTEIEKNIKPEAKCLIGQRFSTTTDTIEATSCIALMDTFKKFFDHKFLTECGIPNVTLQGKLEDWEALAASARKAIDLFKCDDENLSLEWWSKGLFPVLDKLVKCYISPSSKDIQDWMARIFKYNREDGSGEIDHVTGWINAFFPYTKELATNDLAGHAELQPCIGGDQYQLTLSSFPLGISEAPFSWFYLGEVFKNMSFLGGPCITEQVKDCDTAVSPLGSLHVQFGWAVVYPHDGPEETDSDGFIYKLEDPEEYSREYDILHIYKCQILSKTS